MVSKIFKFTFLVVTIVALINPPVDGYPTRGTTGISPGSTSTEFSSAGGITIDIPPAASGGNFMLMMVQNIGGFFHTLLGSIRQAAHDMYCSTAPNPTTTPTPTTPVYTPPPPTYYGTG